MHLVQAAAIPIAAIGCKLQRSIGLRCASLCFSVIAFGNLAFTQTALPASVIQGARIRQKAEETFRTTQDFACLETVWRAERKPRAPTFRDLDSLSLEVAEVHGQELYSWRGHRQFGALAPRELVAAGLTSSGEFLGHVRNVLLSGNARIQYAGAEEIRGVPSVRYRYWMPQRVSGYRISFHGQSAVVGSEGSIWADATSLELVRMHLTTVDIPPQLAVKAVRLRIDFSAFVVNGRRQILPDAAAIIFDEDNGLVSRNDIVFTHCREYKAESSITFSDQPLTASATAALQQSTPFDLPAGVMIPMVLSEPLDFSKARIGDPVQAIVSVDVFRSRHLLLPKGTKVLGRVRLAESMHEIQDHFIAGIELTQLSIGQTDGPFRANLVDFGPLAGMLTDVRKERNQTRYLINHGRMDISEIETSRPLALPGVGVFLLADKHVILPAGLTMRWLTISLKR